MKIKRLLAACLLFVLLFSAFPAYALAGEPGPEPEIAPSPEETAPEAPQLPAESSNETVPPPEPVPSPASGAETDRAGEASGASEPEVSPEPTDTQPDTDREPPVPIRLKAPEILGYTVSKSPFSKGDTLTVTVSLRHSDLSLSQAGGSGNLDIIKLADSFSGGSLSWNITGGSGKLSYELTFSQLKYSGYGKSLRFMVESRDGSFSFPGIELTLPEAQEYDAVKEAAACDSLAAFSGGGGGGAYSTESSVPRLVISEYSYGDKSIAAGSKFSLGFTLLNTGKTAVENIVISIDGGESFTMDRCSNTLFYSKIPSSGKETLSVDMQALPGAGSGAKSIGISCKYEYLDGGRRANTAAEIKLSVPVVQPDRFHVNPPSLPQTVNAGEEQTLSLSYVNKGKGQVSNVEAIIEGSVDSPARSQYLGNFDPGKSGSIGFVFTPQSTGPLDLVLKVSYEDANQELHNLSFPVSLNVQEAPKPEAGDMDMDSGGALPGTALWLTALAVLALAGLLLGRPLVKKLREKKAVPADGAAELNWDDWDEAATGEENKDKSPGGK